MRIRTALRGDAGASAVEYGLIIAAIAAVIVGVVFVLGGTARNAYSQTNDCITAGAAATC